MEDFFFAMKMAGITLVMVLAMQIRVGSGTIEQHSHAWLQTSSIVTYLRHVADGAVRFTRESFSWASDKLDTNVSGVMKGHADQQSPGRRSLGLRWERSPQYKAERDKAQAESESTASSDEADEGLTE